MRVYINQLNIELSPQFASMFQSYFQKKYSYMEVFTDEARYHIDSKHVHRVEVLDKEIVSYPGFYKNVTLVVDHSTYTKQRTSSVCGQQHVAHTVCNYVYRMPSHTHIQLVIQYRQQGIKETPWDIYFEVLDINLKKGKDQQLVTKRDIDDLFVKNELIEFLSHLF